MVEKMSFSFNKLKPDAIFLKHSEIMIMYEYVVDVSDIIFQVVDTAQWCEINSRFAEQHHLQSFLRNDIYVEILLTKICKKYIRCGRNETKYLQ